MRMQRTGPWKLSVTARERGRLKNTLFRNPPHVVDLYASVRKTCGVSAGITLGNTISWFLGSSWTIRVNDDRME